MINRSKRVLKLCQLIFLSVGVIFLCVAIYSALSSSRFSQKSKTVIGKIIGLNKDAKVSGSNTTIAYEVDGVTYQETMRAYKSSWYEGEELSILYELDNPKNIRLKNSLYVIPTIFSCLGALFIVLMVVIIIYEQQIIYRQKRLETDGNRVLAVIIGCIINDKIKIYGRHPYRIEATYEDLFSKEVYHFLSPNIYHDPPNMFGLQVPVYVNPRNSKDYYMDLVYVWNELWEKKGEKSNK